MVTIKCVNKVIDGATAAYVIHGDPLVIHIATNPGMPPGNKSVIEYLIKILQVPTISIEDLFNEFAI